MTNLPELYHPPPPVPPQSGWVTSPPTGGPSGYHTHLPADLAAEITSLFVAHQQAEAIAAEADGRWGPFGWDAATGLIPGVGALYTAFKGIQLQRCAAQGRCGFGTRFAGFLLSGIDIAVGVVVGFGDIIDALFRSSAIHAGMIKVDIARRLHLLLDAEDRLERQGYLTDADIELLRNHAFRGGRSEAGQGVRNLVGLGVLLFLLYSCAGG